jgi:cell wall-associated NlpC family hydrolase
MASLVAVGALAAPAGADEDDPSGGITETDVAAAQAAATESELSLAEVEQRLAAANERAWDASIAAEQATEAYHGARWRLQAARRAARIAEAEHVVASADAARQREIYGDALVTSYQMAPELTALSAIVRSDGIQSLIERSGTMMIAESALGARYDVLDAANQRADRAASAATTAGVVAATAATRTRSARDAARAAARSARATAAVIAGEREKLITRLAQLRGISVELAAEHQAALDATPPQPPSAPATQPAPASNSSEGPKPPRNQEPAPSAPTAGSAPSPAAPAPSSTPPPAPPITPDPPTTTAPPVSAGASRAVAFAREQLGEKYRYGAAGPNAWDCSGLTMKAWAAGGKSLPHYSGAQYSLSTPITANQLRPGDLLFWASNRSPSSIYHVGLYVGGGRMIHAPRTGQNVSEVSINYWIPATFFARP